MTIAFLNARIVLPADLGGPRVTTLRFAKRIISLDKPPQRGDQTYDLAGCTVYPGLINAHDHLELNHYPRSRFRQRYTNAHQWGDDFLPRLETEPFASLRRLPLDEQCRIGGLKNLHSGVTTVAHHNPPHPVLFRPDFPVTVVRRYGWAHSLYFTAPEAIQRAYRRTPRNAPFMIYLAEGTDESAAKELNQFDSLGCLHKNTVIIHGVGLSESDQARVLNAGAGLVWCPSTNLFLLGQTGDVRAFAAARRLALGSDSLLTADGDLLAELKAAAATNQISAEALFRAVTVDAARLLRLSDRGMIRPGMVADLLVTRVMPGVNPYEALIAADRNTLMSVYRNGQRAL